MKSLNIIILFILPIAMFAQDKCGDYIMLNENDTIFSSIVTFERKSGSIASLSYFDTDGRIVNYKGRTECLQVKSFCSNGQTFDLISTKKSNASAYKRHLWRKVDGLVKVYYYSKSYTTTTKGAGGLDRQEDRDLVLHFVLLDEPTYHSIDMKSWKNTILPYLTECNKFAKIYEGSDLGKGKGAPVEEAVKLYNYVCQE